jgi:ubiquinone/menaquinone biosynthesis C-methylase UbiE
MDWHTRYEQQARWTSNLRAYLLERAQFSNAGRILDVGCGTGALLRLPDGTQATIHGLDIDQNHLAQASEHAPGAALTQADAHHLPYAGDSFDLAWCHYVLLWLKQPLQSLMEMVRVVRRGGFVLAFAEPDYGGRIDYPPALEAAGHTQINSLLAQAADPFMGRKLSALFNQVGLISVEVGVMGGQWDHAPERTDFDAEWAVLYSDLGYLQKTSSEKNALEDLKELDWAAWQTGERVLYVPTFYAAGRKP